jgi:hypothetical protein
LQQIFFLIDFCNYLNFCKKIVALLLFWRQHLNFSA